MGWGNRLLLVPHVVRLGIRAPRDVGSRWDRYWADVGATGDGGDVLWDSSDPAESQRYADLLVAEADLRLPVVDIGCGNGRFTRALAARFPRAIGLDLSAHAVERALQEGRDLPPPPAPVDFRAEDMTADGAGRRLAAEFGRCNVFVRGVLHVLDPPARRRLAANIRALVGAEGTVLVAETNYPGPLLGYLESLGAGSRGVPHALARAISAGIPRPVPFGAAELEDCFPSGAWDRVLLDEKASITAVPMQRANVPESIPALVAVLRRRGVAGSTYVPGGPPEDVGA